MCKITLEFETKYDVGNVVIFEKNNQLNVGIIEGYYEEDRCIWYNIRVSGRFVYTYSNGGDIAEWNIVGKIEDELREDSYKKILSL